MKNNKENFNPDFIQIPQIVMYLPPADRFVFGAVYFFCQLSQKRCIASNQKIGEIAGISADSVSNSLTKLEEEGLIQRYYKDNNKRTRDYMICLVKISKIPSPNGLDTTKRLDVIPSGNEQIYNTNIKENIANAKEPIKKDDTPFIASDKILEFVNSPQKWLKIIGLFAQRKRLDKKLKTLGQLQLIIPRYRKVATELGEFSGAQIKEAFDKCDEMRDKQGNQIDWTLFTVRSVLLK